MSESLFRSFFLRRRQKVWNTFSGPVFSFPTPVFSFPTPVFTFPTPVFSFPTAVFSFPTPVFSFPTPVFSFPTLKKRERANSQPWLQVRSFFFCRLEMLKSLFKYSLLARELSIYVCNTVLTKYAFRKFLQELILNSDAWLGNKGWQIIEKRQKKTELKNIFFLPIFPSLFHSPFLF